WIGAAMAGGLTEAIGLAAAWRPDLWLSLFGTDPAMLEVGARYLRIAAPFYGLFGAGLALYFGSQGAGRLGWPLLAAMSRLTVAVGGGMLAVVAGLGPTGVFAALALALATFGLMNIGAVALGGWGARAERSRPQPLPEPRPAA
ncbi:MAG TPA: MATE family efflux transporter, partial [Enterovirga sp.]